MSYQDGLGTWVWNEDLAVDTNDVRVAVPISFVSNGITYTELSYRGTIPPPLTYMDYNNTIAYNAYAWTNEAYRTINITSPPPADFLEILQGNATYQEPAVTTYKLTINGKRATINGKSKGTLTFGGKTYQWDNSAPTPTDELLGTWAFNETVDLTSVITGTSPLMVYGAVAQGEVVDKFQILFSSNNVEYSYIGFASGSPAFYGTNNDVYYADDNPFSGKTKGWQNQAYRTITITDTSTLTNREEFTAWLKANAVKQ